ncbi:family 78 glycoside hydrolase catalytic domain [Subtercola sp. RTI3]|uniref:family 78 glycoside hydrolase catalytic domain n=1 Tax=Subtercola sp. RTI3 TaxID=3048639 RepID=UPI002B2377BA|nr:family 78 glycoside hydrolase catalytic domain [Subtercola sp. RTI3]MEA9984031.1 family 78 glycoside hydrolase catalytic domain [Subtercola sp. RTI3]
MTLTPRTDRAATAASSEATPEASGCTVSALWAGTRGRPAFLPTGAPALSWQVVSASSDWRQRAYTLELEQGGATLTAEGTGPVSQSIPWPFAPLAAYASARVRVRVRGAAAGCSEFSPWTELLTGPLSGDDWAAEFITAEGAPGSVADPAERELGDAPKPAEGEPGSAPETAAGAPGDSHEPALNDPRPTVRFRREFTVDRPIRRALLSATARGVYEPVVNGQLVGDEVLAPGWTSYDKRLLFQTFDVTDQIVAGTNVLGATVAEGWYRERYGFDGRFAVGYDGPVALSMQLRLEYADAPADVDLLTTDSSWSTTLDGPTVSASIYQGETYDARREDLALASPGTPFADARPATGIRVDRALLAPASAPPVRRIERVRPVESIATPSGGTVIDFGQNLVGWLEVTIDAPAGTVITLRHAEVLENGELGIRPLRFASATDHYTARGDGPVSWSPRFTFHGFRYAEITVLPSGSSTPTTGTGPGTGTCSSSTPTPTTHIDLDAVTAVVVHSDMLRTGHFESSNPLLNQLHENVLWGMRGNFLSLPTDCPQRDERLGWTGDIQVFTPTASFLYDSSGFLQSWLRDLALEQEANGGIVPMVVPAPITAGGPATAAWGDSATLVADDLYTRFGDRAILATQYPGMRAWVEVVRGLAGANNLWTGGFQFGDWLDPSAPPENPSAAKTDPDIVATAYYFKSTRQLAAAARVLGFAEDARQYAELAEGIRAAFVREYVTAGGRLMSDAHTAYAITIAFGLVTDPAEVKRVGARLAELVRAYGYRIRTGFVGTPLICDALAAAGQSDVAYRLLLETDCPSWLYPLSMGATTIWERWDSMLPDGTINPGEMTSFNHYALGAVADFMQRQIAGIAPGTPGYETIDIRPVVGGGLSSAGATLETGFGRVAVSWSIEGSTFTLAASIPANSRARVWMPGSTTAVEVGSGDHTFSTALAPQPEAPRTFDLDSSLADIVSSPAASAVVKRVFAETGYFIGLGWTDSGRWLTDSRLGSSLVMFSDANKKLLADALATLR